MMIVYYNNMVFYQQKYKSKVYSTALVKHGPSYFSMLNISIKPISEI